MLQLQSEQLSFTSFTEQKQAIQALKILEGANRQGFEIEQQDI